MASNLEDKIKLEHQAGINSHGISIHIPKTIEDIRPTNIRHVYESDSILSKGMTNSRYPFQSSSPAYGSPLRHHHRNHSSARRVKETLHARSEYTNSEDDGGAVHRINQYQIKQEIGRGSFGAVHLAVDQHGHEYAVKEFSKSRLRKRAQSNVLRRPHAARKPGHLAAGLGFNSPLHQQSPSDIHAQEGGNPLYLIKEEIAIMKKLNHTNLVSLIEVLDDPNEDSLYMVLEMCKKGVVMKIGMDERADPYDEESCRCWFRDLILGIEYLHAQGVVHRDIKPDNLLLTEDDVLKIVDFGVSEMFEKTSEMLTAKSAGSPAFLPPELCVARHGDISGKAADIWSMGITLYCLRYGKIPFEQSGVVQLYESIKNDQLDLSSEVDGNFKDLMQRILEKDPSKRIQMPELRDHPWVTNSGADPLLSAEDNTANLIEPPTEEETNEAITGNLSNILVIMKAVKRFKNVIAHKRPHRMEGILGGDAPIVQPPLSISRPAGSHTHHKTRSVDTHDRRPIESALVAGGVHRDIDLSNFNPAGEEESAIASSPNSSPVTPTKTNIPKSPETDNTSPTSPRRDLHATPKDHRARSKPSQPWTIPIPNKPKDYPGKGHAHDPLSDHLFLAIGPKGDSEPPDPPAVSESPPATDVNIYETAYHSEVERIREKRGKEATLYLTRRVDKKKEYREDRNMMGVDRDSSGVKGGFARILDMARKKGKEGKDEDGNGNDKDGDDDSETK